MNTRRWMVVAAPRRGWVMLLVLASACKDDDPCDPDQEERGPNACYPAPKTSSSSSAGSSGAASTDDADSGASTPGGDFEFGQPCTDPADSSDCGGIAPVCIPLPSGPVCTQVLCLEGEVNAGACTAEWPCTEVPGFPSTCLKP